MTGLECGLEDLAALASIPYRSHHQRMSEGATGPAEHLERSRKPFEREARVQSFLLEETEEAARGAEARMTPSGWQQAPSERIMGILTAATKVGIFTPPKRR